VKLLNKGRGLLCEGHWHEVHQRVLYIDIDIHHGMALP